MKYLALTVSLLLLLSIQAFSLSPSEHLAFSPCTLTLPQSPAVHGVKLGMSPAELNTLFPGIADALKTRLEKADAYPYFGLVTISLSPSVDPTKDQFAGIAFYKFEFFDGHLERFDLQYAGPPIGPRWLKVDDFIARLADAFKLPAAGDWTPDPKNNSQKSLKCNGFEIQAASYDAGSLVVSTLDLARKQKERQAAYEEKKRREFKP